MHASFRFHWAFARTILAPTLVVALAACSTPPNAAPTAPTAPPTSRPSATGTPPPPAREPFQQEIPGAAFRFELRPIPASADGSIKPFFIGATELTWEAFDTFVYRLDEDNGKPPPGGPDAVTRPSKPYLPPDRGFGHEGFAAITMSFKNATEFCVWLSKHSGRTYRLPTEAEWEHAARAGNATEPTTLDEVAWFETNSNGTTHPVAKKKPNAFGLFDTLGNVAEWCVAPDGTGVTRGGSYRDPAAKVRFTSREPANRAWNASDPQIPKSQWWLADGPFIGFRVLCEDPAASSPPAK